MHKQVRSLWLRNLGNLGLKFKIRAQQGTIRTENRAEYLDSWHSFLWVMLSLSLIHRSFLFPFLYFAYHSCFSTLLFSVLKIQTWKNSQGIHGSQGGRKGGRLVVWQAILTAILWLRLEACGLNKSNLISSELLSLALYL